MNLRQFLFLMIATTGLCWFGWFLVLFNIDPYQTNWFGFLFFYLSLFLSLLGTGSIIFLGFNYWRWRQEIALFRQVELSLKQSLVLASFSVFLLFLQAKKVLNLFIFLTLILIFFIILSIIISIKKNKTKL